MGREVWIYKLKNEKAKTGLRKLLGSEFGFSYSFENFLKSRQNEEILLSIHKCLIITPELLFEITYWLSEEIGLNDKEQDYFLTNEIGTSLIFESSTKSEANSFMIFYYNHLDSIQENKESLKISESGIITDSYQFVYFLDYFILFLYEINILNDGNNEYSIEMNREIDKIYIDRNKDANFINLLKSELSKFKSLFALRSGNPIDINPRTYTDLELIHRNFEFLRKSINMKRKTENKNTKIIIIDSK